MNMYRVVALRQQFKSLGDDIDLLHKERITIQNTFTTKCNTCETDDGQDCRNCVWNLDADKQPLVDNWRDE